MSNGGMHADVLPDVQRGVLRRVAEQVTQRGFYLAGGTALALQLGHRQSVDFDWFRDGAISDPTGLAQELGLTVTSTSENTLHSECDGVSLSFFTYRYPLLAALVSAESHGCKLASVPDIAAMKLAAITQRGTRKDYIDLVAIGRAGTDLPSMLAAYREKYSVANIGHVLVALTWFDDADRDPESWGAAIKAWGVGKAPQRRRV